MARCGVFQEVIECMQNRVSGKFAGVAGIYNRYEYKKEKREALEKWGSYLRQLTGTPSTALKQSRKLGFNMTTSLDEGALVEIANILQSLVGQ